MVHALTRFYIFSIFSTFYLGKFPFRNEKKECFCYAFKNQISRQSTNSSSMNGAVLVLVLPPKFYFVKSSKDLPFRYQQTECFHMVTTFFQVHVTLKKGLYRKLVPW